MEQGLMWVGISAGALLLLSFLFQVEAVRGRRIILPGVRGALDRVIARTTERMSRLSAVLGAGAVRILIHYGIHCTLAFLLRILRGIEARIARLQLSNKRVAKAVRREREEDKTHLDLIAEHKEETSLSPEERRRRRSH